MEFVFRRRLKLFDGLGLNISKSGISTSLRTSLGSINKNGASFRTGNIRLQYKHSWKVMKNPFVFFFAITLLTSCDSSENEQEIVPVDTRERGVINFTFKNTEWKSESATALYANGHYSVFGGKYVGNRQVENFYILMSGGESSQGVYSLNFNNQLQYNKNPDDQTSNTYGTTSLNCMGNYKGEIIITELDTIKKVISGNFTGLTYFTSCSDTATIKGDFYKVPISKAR